MAETEIKIRLKDEEKRWIAARATENGRSIRAEIAQLIKNSMRGSDNG
jgi:plasmid stability protein